MSKFRLKPPSPALVIAIIALIMAMAGTGYALSKNSVGTKQLKNGAVTTKKLHNGAVTTKKLHNGAVTQSKLASGLSVANANHANSADNATNATTAGNANSVGGRKVQQFAVNDPKGTANHTVLTVDGITFQAGCDGANNPQLTVQNLSGVVAALDGHTSNNTLISVDPFGSSPVSLTGGLNGGNTATVTRVDGVAVSATYGASGLSGTNCRVSASVIAG